jgi:sarcosine oxidase subunit delta
MNAASARFRTHTDMLRIPCPWCGERDEIEFRYRGDATVQRPAADAGMEAYVAYVYARDNPLGWHLEWWLHTGGCRRLLKVLRHTLTHEIREVLAPGEWPQAPGDTSAP